MSLKQKAYVVNNNVHVLCPACGVGMRGIVRKETFQVKIQCKFCNEQFILELDYRKQYRKPTSLFGDIFCASGRAFHVVVKDISMGGLRFQCVKYAKKLSINETVKMRFQLDDKRRSKITVTMKICHKYADGEFGGIFLSKFSSPESMKKIGFWLR